LVAKLRVLDEPAKLFGETHRQRLKRYRRLTGQENAVATLTDGPIPTTLELVPEAEMKVEAKLPKRCRGTKVLVSTAGFIFHYGTERMGDCACTAGRSMSRRVISGQASIQCYGSGKREHAAFVQKNLKRGDVEDGILEPVVENRQGSAGKEDMWMPMTDTLRLSIGKGVSFCSLFVFFEWKSI